MEELEQEHAMEGGLLEEATSDTGYVTKGNLTSRMKEITGVPEEAEGYAVLKEYKTAYEAEKEAKKAVKGAEKELDKKMITKHRE